jgi:ribosomal protein S18 acetylase RimI-like enzyme
MSVTFHVMTLQDYPQVLKLWRSVEGMGLGESDREAAIRAYLARNPNMSFVVRSKRQVIAAVLCGHDGRRGFIHHLAVHPDHRRKDLGRALVKRCLQELEAAGILKCHVFIYSDNIRARAFWRALGWTERVELTLMSQDLPPRVE